MTRLVIHAGIHRTGTTALQRVLAESRSSLREQGVLYPFDGPNHQDIAWAILRGDLTGVELREQLAERSSEEVSTVVLSGEDFCVHEDLGWVADLRQSYEVQVALYLRRQDLWLASWYNQHVKWPFNREKSQATPGEFLDTVWEYHWLDFRRLLDRWETAVGKDAVHLALLDSSEETDVVADFAGVIGVDATELKRADRRANDSLPVASLELARHLNLIDRDGWERNMIETALRRAFAGRSESSEMVFSPAERRQVLARFAESNNAVARARFGRETLFGSRPPEDGDPHFEFPDVGRDELLREWVAPFVTELVWFARQRIDKK